MLLARHRLVVGGLFMLMLGGTSPALAVQTADAQVRLSAEAAKRWPSIAMRMRSAPMCGASGFSVWCRRGARQWALCISSRASSALRFPALRQAIKLKPALPNVSALLAMSLSELGQFQEALPGLERAFKQPSDTALRRAAGLQLQRAYTGLARDADAVGVALQLTRLYPDDPEILYHASRLHANFAFVTLRSLAAVRDSLWVHLAAGEANESQGVLEAALKEYRAVVVLDPKRPGLHFRIGRVLLARAERNPDAAVEAEGVYGVRRGARQRPDQRQCRLRSGGDPSQGRRCPAGAPTLFETALAHYPDFEEALVGLGRTLIVLEQPALAIARLKRAIALNPKSEVAYYQLAQAHRALGDTAAQEKALATFEQLRSAAERPTAAATPARSEVTKQKLDPGLAVEIASVKARAPVRHCSRPASRACLRPHRPGVVQPDPEPDLHGRHRGQRDHLQACLRSGEALHPRVHERRCRHHRFRLRRPAGPLFLCTNRGDRDAVQRPQRALEEQWRRYLYRRDSEGRRG